MISAQNNSPAAFVCVFLLARNKSLLKQQKLFFWCVCFMFTAAFSVCLGRLGPRRLICLLFLCCNCCQKGSKFIDNSKRKRPAALNKTKVYKYKLKSSKKEDQSVRKLSTFFSPLIHYPINQWTNETFSFSSKFSAKNKFPNVHLLLYFLTIIS